MGEKPVATAEIEGDGVEALLRFLSGDNSGLKCTICGAKPYTCDCWTKCACGWSFEKGTRCRNPIHRKDRP